MAKADWDKIRKEWEKGEKTLKELSDKHGVALGTLKSKKSREKWDEVSFEEYRVAKMQEVATKRKVIVEDDGLNEKQRLFCVYYIKNFNATSAAIKAGYAPQGAHVEGSRLLRHPKVGAEIRRLKEGLHQELFLDVKDIIAAYAKIAFADLSDFTKFGRKEIPYMTEDGPLEDENGNQIMQEVNYVDFRNWDEVDGTLITEVKNGKDGPVIKLADKMKALEMLTKYFDLLSERDRQKLQEEKLRVDIEKGRAETKRLDNNEDDSPIEIVISRKGER